MAFANPATIVDQLEIEAGSTVADLGAGAGFYTVLLADRVGNEGTVYAIDVQPELLTKAKTLDATKRTNIEFLQGDLEEEKGTHLAPETVEYALLVNVLFQLENKEAALREAFRILKRGGQLFVADWTDSFGGLGPPEDHIISEADARALAENIGFAFSGSIDAGDHHWGALFEK